MRTSKELAMIEKDDSQAYPVLDVELLGKPIHKIRDDLTRLLNQSVPDITLHIQHWARVSDFSLEFKSISTVRCCETAPDYYSSIFCHQQQGLLRLSMTQSLLMALSDRFYGADIARKAEGIPSLSSSDKRLQQRIGHLFAKVIAPEDMWRQTESQLAPGAGLQAQYTVSFGDHQGELWLELDATLIQTLLQELAPAHTQPIQPRFHTALTQTPVHLTAVLSRKTMPLDQVLSLKPDDILPIELLNQVPVTIGHEQLFNGRIAEQNGQLVLILQDSKEQQR